MLRPDGRTQQQTHRNRRILRRHPYATSATFSSGLFSGEYERRALLPGLRHPLCLII